MLRRFDSQYGFERANRHSQSCSPVTYMLGGIWAEEHRCRGIKMMVGRKRCVGWLELISRSPVVQWVRRDNYVSSGIVLGVFSFSVSVCPWYDGDSEGLNFGKFSILSRQISSRVRYGSPREINRSVIMRSLENARRRLHTLEQHFNLKKIIDFILHSSKVRANRVGAVIYINAR